MGKLASGSLVVGIVFVAACGSVGDIGGPDGDETPSGSGVGGAAAARPNRTGSTHDPRGSALPPNDLAPRQIAPSSTATVTSRTPTFRWVLAGAQTGAQIEICADRACSE